MSLKIEFLGTAGAIPTPRPFCTCRVCKEARLRGIPYSRMGPSVFVHGPDILIDTPEEVRLMLDRSSVSSVPACTFSHWHPDHTAGRRVFETMNADWLNWPANHHATTIYVPQQVAIDFEERLGLAENFRYLQRFGVVDMVPLSDGDSVLLNGWKMTPFRVAEDYVYAFLFEGEGKRVLVAPDELVGWDPPEFVRGLDLAVIPMGIPEFDVFTGERAIPRDHPVLPAEATYRQTLGIARKLAAEDIIMTHIEEPFHLSYDDLSRLSGQLKEQGLNITFAYDSLIVEV